MKKILYKIVSILVIAIFVTGQVSTSFAYDNLGVSLASDGDINPERSQNTRNAVGHKLEPGAIGNGAPLLALIQGNLPTQIPLSDDKTVVSASQKVREAIDLAIYKYIENRANMPSQHVTRAKQTLTNLISLQNDLTKRLYLYNAVVEGPEDYLLGFSFEEKVGLSIELVNLLYSISPIRLAQYVYHECVYEKGMATERDDHRVVYREIQTPIFGEEEIAALGKSLRNFINIEITQEISMTEWMPVDELDGKILINQQTGQIKFAEGVNPVVQPTFELVSSRHGASLGNEKYILQGDKNEFPLNYLSKNGKQQAEIAARELFDLLGEDKIRAGKVVYVVSELARAQQTADAFIKLARERLGIDLEYTVEPANNEFCFGKWGNNDRKTFAEGQDKAKIDWHRRWKDGYSATARPLEGETFLEVIYRMKKMLEKFNRAYRGKTVVVFDHGTCITAKRVLLGDKFLVNEDGMINWQKANFANGEVRDLTNPEGMVFSAKKAALILDKLFEKADTWKGRDWTPIMILDKTYKIAGSREVERNVLSDLFEKMENKPSNGNEYRQLVAFWNSKVTRSLMSDPAERFTFVQETVEKNGTRSYEILKRTLTEKSKKPTFSSDKEELEIHDEDIEYRAELYKANLMRVLTEHPDQLFFIGVETDIGEAQKAQIMPIYKAVDEIRDMQDASGKPLFPNLMVRRAKAGELATMVSDLNKDGKLNLNNAFIGARKVSVDNKAYDAIKGEGRAWIAAIDDSKPGDYLPVFEAITLNMMAYLNADLAAIKNFYDAISNEPIDLSMLQDMLKNRIIYILPKASAFDAKQLRELYELARQVYIAA